MKTIQHVDETTEMFAVETLLWCASNNWGSLPDWIKQEYDQSHVVFTPAVLYISNPRWKFDVYKDDYVGRQLDGTIFPYRSEEEVYPSSAPHGTLYVSRRGISRWISQIHLLRKADLRTPRAKYGGWVIGDRWFLQVRPVYQGDTREFREDCWARGIDPFMRVK